MKKIVFVLVTVMVLQMCFNIQIVEHKASATVINNSKMLKVKGNKIVWDENENVEVVLTGVNVPGGEWTGLLDEEKVFRSTLEAMDRWECNFIRLCVGTAGWNGNEERGNKADYRAYIDNVINEISKRGKYVILDLHEYTNVGNTTQLQFWRDISEKYGNNPTVLFGLLNEPKGVNWEQWRNGSGAYKGHQYVVEMIRDLGAKNILVAGGRNFSNDLTGIVNGYALVDQGTGVGGASKKGNGIMYDLHMYPWHAGTEGWQNNAGEVRKLYPIVMGEFGWDNGLEEQGKKNYQPGHQRYHDKWFQEIFDWMNNYEEYGNYCNWTAFSFHPGAAPRMLESDDVNSFKNADYLYMPTDYDGIYIQQELKNRLGYNILKGKTVTASTDMSTYPATNAIDGDKSTGWFDNKAAKYLEVDLGETFIINRWIVHHEASNPGKSGVRKAYTLQKSNDAITWTDVDSVTDNDAGQTDRYFPPTEARYVRLLVINMPGEANQAFIYEFSVTGKDARNIAQEEPPCVDQGYTVIASEDAFNFKSGDTAQVWSGSGSVSYPTGTAEDGASSTMQLKGTAEIALLGTMSNLINADDIYFKYKSTDDVSWQYVVDDRGTGVKTPTKTITVPSSGGQWKELKVPLSSLMPTPSDTWVNNMQTVFNLDTGKYEPVIIMKITVPSGVTLNLERMSARWHAKKLAIKNIEFTNGEINCNDGLRIGTTDINIQLSDGEFKYVNDLVLMTALINKKTGAFHSMDNFVTFLAPKYATVSRRLSLTLPEEESPEDYCIKVMVWRDTKSMNQVVNAITYDVNGIHYN